MDMDALMTKQGMRTWTDEQRETYVNDASDMRQMAQIIQARIANTHIEGDKNAGQARRRAAKVVRRLNKVIRHLERAAAEMEAGNAVYVREVLELPERRVKELERNETRRSRLGLAAGVHETVAKSLDRTAHALHGTQPVGNPQVTPVQQAPQYVSPQPYAFPGGGQPQQPIPHISELFDQEAM
jgi:hypothetical protein